MKVELIAKIETPTTILGGDGFSKKAIGTGYPVSDGLVITARHVLYHEKRDTNERRCLSWQRSDEDEPYHSITIDQSAIVFESKAFDVALIRCDTSKLKISFNTISHIFPEAGNKWESMGYPRAGVQAGQRIKSPAKGAFFTPDPDYSIQQLVSEGDAYTGELWKGMSGAPVFDCKSNLLVGVLIRTPHTYKATDQVVKEVFENRLIAASIPYLLREGKCEGFRKEALPALKNKLIPEIKTGDDFKQYLIKRIGRELRKTDNGTKIFCNELAEELELELEEGEPKPKDIAKRLVQLTATESINVLTIASGSCVLPKGLGYAEIGAANADEVKSTAQQILGWLVLSACDETKLNSVLAHCSQHDSLFFTLAAKSLTGVEVVMARRFNRPSHLEHKVGSEQKSRYVVKLPEGKLDFNKEESCRVIFNEIWNQAFPAEHRENQEIPRPEDWERLNEELASLREDEVSPRHYYIPFKASEYQLQELSDYVEEVYKHFLSRLDQMTIIQYGKEGEDGNLFCVSEPKLRASINKFYRNISSQKGIE